jgi:UDP-N-acetylglucosamine 2-epimerase
MKKKNKKIKILTVVGTRPELIRLSTTINLLDKYCEHILLHTGQNYDIELKDNFFSDLKIKKPKYQININKNKTAINFISEMLNFVEKVILKETPMALIILGDTNSCLSAYVGKRYKIPIFHIEAGNRSFDQRVPEEVNRKLIDHLSDVNITYSNYARENLLRENFPSDKVFKIGSPLYEVFQKNIKKIKKSKILKKLGLVKNQYYVCSLHREENIENEVQFKKITQFFDDLVNVKKLKIIFSTHPRTR